MAIYWSTPDFKGRTFKLCVLTRWDFNFCVRSSHCGKRNQSEWTEAWDGYKLQIPWLSYSWWRFQAWDTLQDSTGNSSIDKTENTSDWQEYFSQFQDTTDALPLSHLSSCMLVNHGPSQQSSKKEYKPWKWGATARYYTPHTKTMLPTRKSMPRSSRQLDHMKISWR